MTDTQTKPVLKVCGQPCEVYSRVVGYLRPVQQWNKGKRAEYAQRVEYRAMTDAEAEAWLKQRFGAF